VHGPGSAAQAGTVRLVGARHQPGRRRSRRFLPAVLVIVLTTIGTSGGVVWLAAHLLPHATGEPPMADVVELFKFALVVGLSKWVASV
jgi:hypothetical protein